MGIQARSCILSSFASFSMNRALCLLKILGQINNHLYGDLRALAAVIRVNHTWFACGINILWQAPPCRALANITKDRRQLYATYVYHLSIEQRFLSQLEGLAFPRLQYLSINRETGSSKEWSPSLPCLAPSLLELALCGTGVEPSILGLLPKSCPLLTKLTLKELGPGISSQDLLILLENNPRVQELHLLCRTHNVVCDQVLTSLALRRNLKTLELDTWMTVSHLRGISGLTHPPFPAVEYLAMQIVSPAVSQFVESFRSAPLRKMEITVQYSGGNRSPGHATLMALSHFVFLEVLHIRFSGNGVVLRDELKVFRNLENLRTLTLEPDQDLHPENGDFTDDDVDQLLLHLPLLENFSLYYQSKHVTTSIWRIIAARCPRLMRCEVPVGFVPESQQKQALFPRLETLIIDGIYPRSEAGGEKEIDREATRIVKLIQHHFPRLREFENWVFDDFSELVNEKWRAELNVL
ncbi:hypothetical protein N7471_010413 [Penicillium samsonianum]|uniref:uncharacterized protein n=1 Tax=Penicillium samsonianum TaxID=1882272 RepID=UPI002548C3DE|nr:uncharacterized protein N7471_010413 [Penicillium samsonianum]KAJ6125920.1 hypothetical protein N7471_010413 [Penicillium samsonianum]